MEHILCAKHLVKCCKYFLLFNAHCPYEMGDFTVLISQVRKLKVWEVK